MIMAVMKGMKWKKREQEEWNECEGAQSREFSYTDVFVASEFGWVWATFGQLEQFGQHKARLAKKAPLGRV